MHPIWGSLIISFMPAASAASFSPVNSGTVPGVDETSQTVTPTRVVLGLRRGDADGKANRKPNGRRDAGPDACRQPIHNFPLHLYER